MIREDAHAGVLHPIAQMRMYLVHRLGQESPRGGAGLFAELRQKAAPFDYMFITILDTCCSRTGSAKAAHDSCRSDRPLQSERRPIEERRISQLHSSGAKIVAGVKRQLVNTGFKTIGRDQRFVRSAIHIGNGRFYKLLAKVQIDRPTFCAGFPRDVSSTCVEMRAIYAYLFKRKPRTPNGGRASV